MRSALDLQQVSTAETQKKKVKKEVKIWYT